MIRELIKNIFKLCGLYVRGYNIHNVNSLLILKCTELFDIDLIVDVGANIGQYGKEMRSVGYNGAIVSFEPLKTPFERLKKESQKFSDWESYNFGIGRSDGEVPINVSENWVSSSLLDVTETSVTAEPSSRFRNTETVQLISLNKFWENYKHDNRNVYLKIDVQGYELEVLEGASNLLQCTKAIQIELSTTPLYLNAPLYLDVISYLADLGFELFNLEPEFRNPNTGRLLQLDGIFVRKELLINIK